MPNLKLAHDRDWTYIGSQIELTIGLVDGFEKDTKSMYREKINFADWMFRNCYNLVDGSPLEPTFTKATINGLQFPDPEFFLVYHSRTQIYNYCAVADLTKFSKSGVVNLEEYQFNYIESDILERAPYTSFEFAAKVLESPTYPMLGLLRTNEMDKIIYQNWVEANIDNTYSSSADWTGTIICRTENFERVKKLVPNCIKALTTGQDLI